MNDRNSICLIRGQRVFFKKKRIPSKRSVMKKMGVKRKSYAGSLISRVYDHYFKDAVDFSRIYRSYYKHEFNNKSTFIQERYNIEPEISNRIVKENLCMKEMGIHVEGTLGTLLEDPEIERLFLDAIGGVKDENTSWLYH